MPAASLLLLLLARLLRLIPSALGLLPVLLRPPPMAARLPPLALPPFVPRLPTFALRPLAFLPTPSNHARPTQRRAPGLAGPTCIQSLCSTAPQSPPNNIPPHPHAPFRRVQPESSPRPSPPNPAKMHPEPPQEFFGKNSYRARGPQFRPLQPLPAAARPAQPSVHRAEVDIPPHSRHD